MCCVVQILTANAEGEPGTGGLGVTVEEVKKLELYASCWFFPTSLLTILKILLKEKKKKALIRSNPDYIEGKNLCSTPLKDLK